MNDHRWAPLMNRDFGPTVIHALGPDGHAFKWVNSYNDSSYLTASKTDGGKKKSTTPCAGIDELKYRLTSSDCKCIQSGASFTGMSMDARLAVPGGCDTGGLRH
eukprot:591890-Pyramimonas_sp.AAC.1